jgi:hypothetical protein
MVQVSVGVAAFGEDGQAWKSVQEGFVTQTGTALPGAPDIGSMSQNGDGTLGPCMVGEASAIEPPLHEL